MNHVELGSCNIGSMHALSLTLFFVFIINSSMLLYMCVVYAMFSRYFSIWHNFCPARNFVQQGFDMNLAFCNQERQRNEVCCGILFFTHVLNDSLKPVEISIHSMHYADNKLSVRTVLLLFMPGKQKIKTFFLKAIQRGKPPTAVGWKLKTVQLVSCLDWVNLFSSQISQKQPLEFHACN